LHALILASSLLFAAALVVGVGVLAARAWTLWRTFRRFRRTLERAISDTTAAIERVSARAADAGEHAKQLVGAQEHLGNTLAEAQILVRAAAAAWRPLAQVRAFLPSK
jgi:hypothetical protein